MQKRGKRNRQQLNPLNIPCVSCLLPTLCDDVLRGRVVKKVLKEIIRQLVIPNRSPRLRAMLPSSRLEIDVELPSPSEVGLWSREHAAAAVRRFAYASASIAVRSKSPDRTRRDGKIVDIVYDKA
ncbi:unnamed protein product [Sympodiomycopsis kandeliae]